MNIHNVIYTWDQGMFKDISSIISHAKNLPWTIF